MYQADILKLYILKKLFFAYHVPLKDCVSFPNNADMFRQHSKAFSSVNPCRIYMTTHRLPFSFFPAVGLSAGNICDRR